jgi:glycosyltransferase involved in cell wall biosynthesis
MSDRWIVLQEERHRRFGGDLRRGHVLRVLAERTEAITGGWSATALNPLLDRHAAGGPPWARRPAPRLASVESLEPALLADVARRTRPAVLDVHDDPLLQLGALGIDPGPDRRRRLADKAQRNRDAFEILLAPTASFAELAGLPAERTVVAPNGTDTTHIRPGPVPTRPAIGFISGAAAGRGIEDLVAAVRIVRERFPDTRLLLWLVATGPDAEAYLGDLRRRLADEAWIEIATADHADLSAQLARASVLAIPHPPGAYLDVALPIKLADAMAAGRAVAITPRTESARLVRAADAGIVADDGPEALAAALVTLLEDPALAARLGANGRRAAEADLDWRVIGDAVADRVLGAAP